MQDVECFNLFKWMLKDGYSIDQIALIIGLSSEEVELYTNLIKSDPEFLKYSFDTSEDTFAEAQKKAM